MMILSHIDPLLGNDREQTMRQRTLLGSGQSDNGLAGKRFLFA
jgi:hypothetical protein